MTRIIDIFNFTTDELLQNLCTPVTLKSKNL
jgi:hypothetical protein